MEGFRPVVPKLTDPELMGIQADARADMPSQDLKPAKSNMVNNLTLVASSVVLTVIVILIAWQIYKLLKEDDSVKDAQSKEAEIAVRAYKKDMYKNKPSHDDRVMEQNMAKAPLRPIIKSSSKLASDIQSFDIVEIEPEPEQEGNVQMDDEEIPNISDLIAEMSEDKKNVTFLDPSDAEPGQKCNFVARTGRNKGKPCGVSVLDGLTRCKAHTTK